MIDLKDKVVLITGASQGIGKATAQAFAARGAKVALVARSANTLKALAAELPGSLAVPADITDEAAVQRMVAQVKDHFGRIDIVVNNAGRGMVAPLAGVNLQDYRDLFALNVVGPLSVMQQVLPIMQAQGGGHIVNVSAAMTKMLVPGAGLYSSTKHALNNLTDIARAEFAPHGIRVSLVYPGMTNTEFGHNAVNSTDQTAAYYARGDSAESVADLIVQAVEQGLDEVYAESAKAHIAATKKE